ncbi:hypothetical protein OKW43_000146 [Paraburkholderia sp. WC7.3g]
MTAREEHRPVVRTASRERMARRIAERIGLGLDDASAEASFGQIVHEVFADHEARELDRVDRQIVAAQRADGKRLVSHALVS